MSESVEQLRGVARRVADAQIADDLDDALEQIRLLEQLKAVAAATQARFTVGYDARRRAEQSAAGMKAEKVGAGVAQEIALARRESPFRARRHLGWSRVLVTELLQTFAALQSGVTTEWRAMLVARETGWLSAEHRALVDAEVGPKLHTMGDRDTETACKKAAYRLDPRGCVDRISRAAGDRHVSLRPAPDAMTRLSALLPVKEGVAVLAALRAAADTAPSETKTEPRSRGQVMADTLVERVTGQTKAADVPITVDVIITAGALAGTSDEPAAVHGYGPIPAPLARDLITQTSDTTPVWIRRLFADTAGRLVTMKTSARCFTPAMRAFIGLRDGYCRTPYCGAPIRHADHLIPHSRGGPTSLTNAQGLCEACNHAKEHARAGPFSSERQAAA